MTPDRKKVNSCIDWKFFNYLQDVLTKYEDKNHHVQINISVKNNGKYVDMNVYYYVCLYVYGTEEGSEYVDMYYKPNVMHDLTHDKMVYIITIYNKGIDSTDEILWDNITDYEDKNAIEDVYNIIKDRCVRIENEPKLPARFAKTLRVKPK